MRKLLTPLLTVCLTIVGHASMWGQSGGDGSAGNPYLISTAAELLSINGSSDYYKLTQDIVLSEMVVDADYNVTSTSAPYPSSPISFFSGTLDGDNHTIQGLFINNTNTNINARTGLIGQLYDGAVVKNLKIENSYIFASGTGNNTKVGGICGEAAKVSIENCSFHGIVRNASTGNYAYTGGICGRMECLSSPSSHISGCKFSGYVHNTTGGSNYAWAGGIVGMFWGGRSGGMSNCESTGKIEGGTYVGGIAGQLYTSGSNSGFKFNGTATNTNFSNAMIGGVCGQFGEASGDSGTLEYCSVNGIVESLGGDTESSHDGISHYEDSYNYRGGTAAGGIVGNVLGTGQAVIQNCINDATVRINGANRQHAGGIVGYATYYVEISNCANMGDVHKLGAGYTYLGGIAGFYGQSYTKQISNCYNTGHLQADYSPCYLGGIAGMLSNPCQIANCYHAGSVKYPTSGGTTAAAVVAYIYDGSSTTISNCYYDKQICPLTNTGGGTGVFTHQLTGQALSSMGFVAGGRGTTVDATTCYAGLSTIKEAFPDYHLVSTLPAKLMYEDSGNYDTTDLVKNSFIAYVGNGASWSSANNNVEFAQSGDEHYRFAFLKESGEDVLAVTKDDITRHIWMTTEACDCETYETLADGTVSFDVTDKDDLNKVRATINLGKCSDLTINITSDIDLQTTSQTLIDADGNLIADPSTLDEWCPIGTETHPFKGTFNGNNHTITGLYINTDQMYRGLFGVVEGATLQDVAFDNCYVNALDNCYAGMLVGRVGDGDWETQGDATTVSNVVLNRGSVRGFERVGGLVGSAKNMAMTECHNKAGVVSGGYTVGGVVGEAYWLSNITNSSNNGKVEGVSTNFAKTSIITGSTTGGVVGALYTLLNIDVSTALPSGNRSLVEQCFNGGRISGYNAVGGIVGSNGADYFYTNEVLTGKAQGGAISKSFNFGTVTGHSLPEYNSWGDGSGMIGGVSGHGTIHALISNSYNTGYVESDETNCNSVGGVVGDIRTDCVLSNVYNAGVVRNKATFYFGGGVTGAVDTTEPAASLTNGYYDYQMCTMPGATVAETTHEGKGFSTALMTSTDTPASGKPFYGFDTSIWDFSYDGQYPMLKYFSNMADNTSGKQAALVSISPAYLSHNYDDAYTTVDDIAINFTTSKRNDVNWASDDTSVLTIGNGVDADHTAATVHVDGIPYVPCPSNYYVEGMMKATKGDFIREVPFYLFRPIVFADNAESNDVATSNAQYLSQQHRPVTVAEGKKPTGILYDTGKKYNYWDWNGDGEVTTYEAAIVNDLENVYQGGDSIGTTPTDGPGYNMKSFDELRFFTGLTYLNRKEFKRCKQLTSFIIPRNVADVCYESFSTLLSLPAFKLDENPNYTVSDGVLFSSDGKYLTAFPGGKTGTDTSDGKLHWWDIPETVTHVDTTAFAGCQRLDALFFLYPDNVQRPSGADTYGGFGWDAFKDCTGTYGANNGFGVYVHDGTEYGTNLDNFGGFHRFKSTKTETPWSKFNLLRFFNENVSTFKCATLYLPYECTIPYASKYAAYDGDQIKMVGGSVNDVCYARTLTHTGEEEDFYEMRLISVDKNDGSISSRADGLLQPGTPVVVYSNVSAATAYRFLEETPSKFDSGKDYPDYSTVAIPDNFLSGVYADTPVSNLPNFNSYILTLTPESHTGQIGFWRYMGSTVRANSAYVASNNIPWLNGSSNPANGFFLSFSDPTGISNVSATAEEGTWYNMQGIRLNSRPTMPGLYIHNGQKVMVR